MSRHRTDHLLDWYATASRESKPVASYTLKLDPLAITNKYLTTYDLYKTRLQSIQHDLIYSVIDL